MDDISITQRDDLERLCDLAGRLGLAQLPLFRAAADGLLALLRIENTGTVWPGRLIERNGHRPTCFLIGADPGVEHPDPPPPSEWACAKAVGTGARPVVRSSMALVVNRSIIAMRSLPP